MEGNKQENQLESKYERGGNPLRHKSKEKGPQEPTKSQTNCLRWGDHQKASVRETLERYLERSLETRGEGGCPTSARRMEKPVTQYSQ